jgi:hypothetical protein
MLWGLLRTESRCSLLQHRRVCSTEDKHHREQWITNSWETCKPL